MVAHADFAAFRVSASAVTAVSRGDTFSNESHGASLDSPAASARLKGCRSFTVERIANHPTAKSGTTCNCECAVQCDRVENSVTHVKVLVELKKTTTAKGLLAIASFHLVQKECHGP